MSSPQKLPMFEPGELRYTTSSNTHRYDDVASVKLHFVQIPSLYGSQSKMKMPSYLPPNWACYADPEGSQYFVLDSTPRLVTSSNAYLPHNIEKLTYWFNHVRDLLEKGLSSDVELFLCLDDNDCDYYLVDHFTRKQFWLEELDNESLYLTPVASFAHLDLNLEALYWDHVQQFPMHIHLATSKIQELICIFLHGQADQITSLVSTFPFSRDECREFLVLLKQAEDYPNDGRTTCLVARLFHSISSNHFWVHHGQEIARCSRDQIILHSEDEAKRYTWPSRLASPITFGIAHLYASKLGNAYCDNLVYKDVWKRLIASCLQDWMRSSVMSFMALSLYAILFGTKGASLPVVVSAACFGSSILMGIALIHRYEPMADSSADRGYDHLSSVFSQRFGFTLLSIVYSLPKVLFLWGLVVIFGSSLASFATTLACESSLLVAGFASVLVFLVCLAVCVILSETSLFGTWSQISWSFASVFSRGVVLEDAGMVASTNV